VASQLTSTNPDIRRNERALAQQLARKSKARAEGPWNGVTTGIPHSNADLTNAEDIVGLVARADVQGGGEILTNDGGFDQVDSDNLPLGDSASSTHDVALIADFPLVDDSGGNPSAWEDTSGMVFLTGDGSTNNSAELWKLDPALSAWGYTGNAGTSIPYGAPGTSAASAVGMEATIDGASEFPSMPDSCVFSAGAPARVADAASAIGQSGNIAQPVFILTNNVDPVVVYPGASDTESWEYLSSSFGNSYAAAFRAVSCESFGDRVYFLNTWESSVRHRNRLRRTARGTADPLHTNVGSGFIDMDEFGTNGVRCETLGNTLACYFQDGTALVRETGVATSPNAVQKLDSTRGLLSTQGLVNIPNIGHFGIFTDGWWVLDPNGRWTELGVTTIDGKQIEKWRRKFYSLLDRSRLHRISCHYDQEHNWIRIAVPQTGDPLDSGDGSANQVQHPTLVWIYDLNGDRVFTDDYSAHGGITTMGEITIRGDAALQWGAGGGGSPLITGSWDDHPESWGSLESDAGTKRLVHGEGEGLVFFHSDEGFQKDGADPNWSYKSLTQSAGEPTLLKRVDKVSVEHLNSSNTGDMTVTVTGGRGATASQSTTLDMEDTADDVEIAETWFTSPTDENIGITLSGTGKIRIRSFTVEAIIKGTETRG
jgi:hypothetical protein